MNPENAHLVYLIGASGAGKDSLLTEARHSIDGKYPLVFAHRYITRPADQGGENHVELSYAEFARREQHGLFAMSWEAHGNCYGIGIEIDFWRSAGVHVVVNGSRDYLPEAMRRYPTLRVIEVYVSPEVAYTRLKARGREDEEAIRARVARSGEFNAPRHPSVLRFTNHAPLSEAGPEFTRLLLNTVNLSDEGPLKPRSKSLD
jgi:ribose 1,5-bisphosphokinase